MAPMVEKEWTLMFYFASDNALAPEIVSQLKAIKQAGFHPDANVIAQFDPNSENTDTHIFEVNRINKIQAKGKHRIGHVGFRANDPYVVNLMTDKVWRKDKKEGPIRDRIIKSLDRFKAKGEVFDPPVPPPRPERPEDGGGSLEAAPVESLQSFLRFCSRNYPARHYMLFILGHGLVVGNDTFLFDENAPEHSLKLTDLGVILNDFKGEIREKGGVFELVSFHSCSMSSLEVACELQYDGDKKYGGAKRNGGGKKNGGGKPEGTANYMLAAQSPSFVGSWPYRQILIRIFNYLVRKESDVQKLCTDIFSYCLYNSYDFIVAGYNFDVCLCDLNNVPKIRPPLSALAKALVEGLKYPQLVERVLLAHWDAQSYWLENYTDLHDFCGCLKRRLDGPGSEPAGVAEKISGACDEVITVLKKGGVKGDGLPVVRSEFAGTASQYSRGLSVFFPWSPPLNSLFWPTEYNKYRFFTDAGKGETPWSEFLAEYFLKTRRPARGTEEEALLAVAESNGGRARRKSKTPELEEELLEAFATRVFGVSGQLNKGGPRDTQGDDCDCPSIKNYPSFTREPQAEAQDGETPYELPRGSVVSKTFVSDRTPFKQGRGKTSILDNLAE
ncbi:MAG TPA: clostripain-related cysteine peptidase [Pyrinomonadaceae bacterium]|jgi:hypothetical protein